MSPRPDIKFDLSAMKNDLAEKAENLEQKVDGKVLFSDDFTRGEAIFWAVMAAMYCVVVWGLAKLGVTMDMVVIGVVFCTLWEVVIAPRKIKYAERVLKIRKLKENGAALEKKGPKIDHPWIDEENKFILYSSDHIDYAVMKYVGNDVPHVIEQEYLHAKMHHEYQGENCEEDQKWLVKNEPGLNMLRKIFLRRGERLGRLMCGMIEAGNAYGLFAPAATGWAPGNVANFHLFEEAEHAGITVQSLKKQTTAIERFLAFPFYVAMFLPMLPMTMFGKLAQQPALLLKWQTYFQLVHATFKVILNTLCMFAAVFMHWVLPIPFPQSAFDIAHGYFHLLCMKGGVEWDVTSQATYSLYL